MDGLGGLMPGSKSSRKAAFVDRDGVLTKLVDRGEGFMLGGRPHRWTAPWNRQELRFMDEARPALELLERKGYARILVTNQPDVATGNIDPEEFERMMDLVRELPLTGIYTCLHRPKGGCACRKPLPGMLLTARGEQDLDLDASYMIGDMEGDIEAGRAAGVRTILVTHEPTVETNADHRVRSILEAAQLLP